MQPNTPQGSMDPNAPQPVAPQPMPQPVAPQPPTAPSVTQPQPQSPVSAPAQAPVAPMPQQPVQQLISPQPQPAPQPVAAPPTSDALGTIAVADQVQEVPEGYGYDPGEDEEYDEQEIDLSEPITWEAQEYIHQEKGATWFIVFSVVFIVFMVTALFLMKSWSFALLLVVIAGVIVVLQKRPPRTLEYSLSNEGLHIGETLHRFNDFKSFGIIRDGEEFSVMLIPRRRFMPGITVYFPEEAGEDIVDALGSRMPMRDLHLDVIDRVVRKLRL